MSQTHDIGFYTDLLAQHQYALIDRAAASAEMLAKFPLVPLIPDLLKNKDDIKLTPALLPLPSDAPYMALLAECMKAGEKDASENPVDTLIVASPDVGQRLLEVHLTSRLIVYSPQGRAFLRYYSSDIFPHLVRVLSPERLKSLFGPREQVCQWTYRFQNEWISVHAPELTEGVPLSWMVSREERESLDLVGDVNKTLDARQQKTGRPWNSHAEWNEQAAVAERSISVARRIHLLSAPADLIAFGTQALTHGEGFHRHPRIQSLLKDTASRPGAYRDATHGMTDDDWTAMAAELPPHKKH